MCANSEGSGENARMRRLAWAFGGRLCDRYSHELPQIMFVQDYVVYAHMIGSKFYSSISYVVLKQLWYEFQDGQQWKPDTCTTCDCENGITHCQVQQCNNALWCPVVGLYILWYFMIGNDAMCLFWYVCNWEIFFFQIFIRVWTQWVSCKVHVSDAWGRHLNFVRDPLRLCFDECQKNEAHLVTLFLHMFCSLFVKFYIVL